MIKNSGKFNSAGLKALEARIRAMGKKKVVVGVPAATNNLREGELSNATIAAAHEFGVPGHIPERSFLRSTLNENKDALTKELSVSIAFELTHDGDPIDAFRETGQQLVQLTKAKIIKGLSPALSESTKASRKRKASGLSKKQKAERSGRSLTPLYDTGNLIASITYEVRDK